VDKIPGMSAVSGAEVRLAQSEADREAVFAVRHQVFVIEQSVPEELEYDELDTGADHFLALLDGVPVGAGRLIVIDSELSANPDQGMKATGVLGRLAVDKAARGMGLGKLLVRLIEQQATERGLAAVELHAQTHARGFYEQLGYAVHGDLFFEAGIEHVSMRKEL
jgi:predicted GNAT family N-acyltransferase